MDQEAPSPQTQVVIAKMAPPPAPHQTNAFNAERLMAKSVIGAGMVITVLGAISPLLSGWLGANSPTVTICGAIIAAAGAYQHAAAHSAYQAGTDNG